MCKFQRYVYLLSWVSVFPKMAMTYRKAAYDKIHIPRKNINFKSNTIIVKNQKTSVILKYLKAKQKGINYIKLYNGIVHMKLIIIKFDPIWDFVVCVS